MKTITYNVYSFDELSKEAQEKAREKWAQNNDYYFLSDYLNEKLHELLIENNIKDLNNTSKAGTKTTQVFYSLSYSQGDGCMFEGDFVFTYKGSKYIVNVKHSGHYYHYNSKNFTIYDEEGEELDSMEECKEISEVEEAFNIVYKKICKDLEQIGYNFIEYEDSMEAFQQSCEANDYTFTKDGIMDNQ